MEKKKYNKQELFKMDAVDVYKMVLRGDIIKTFPNGFWKLPEAHINAAKCTRFLFEEILKFNKEQMNTNITLKTFKENKLNGMMISCFNNSPYLAINNAYPNKFKGWEFGQVPKNFWTKEKGIEATKWLIEEKLKLSDDELKEKLSYDLFCKNKLSGMLSYCFNNSPYNAINSAYPNKFKEWEFKSTPNNFWTKEKGIEVVKWLVEEKLKLSDDELKEQLSYKLFIENGIHKVLIRVFNSSPYNAINSAYPNKFKEWEFKITPNNFWTKEKAIEATKWLIEEKLKLSDDELKDQLSYKLFTRNGLGGMLNTCYNNSPYKAIEEAYPNKNFKN